MSSANVSHSDEDREIDKRVFVSHTVHVYIPVSIIKHILVAIRCQIRAFIAY